MKKSNSFLSLILFLCLNQCLVYGTNIQPIERSVGNLHISIDPRIELLASIHSLSSNRDLVNRDLSYSKDIINYFKAFSSHESVKLTESLRQEYGFSYDAPVGFMAYLSQPAELEQQIPYSDYLLGRSGKGDNLEKYRKSIKHFSEISNFEAFWNSKISFYNQILDMTIANMEGKDLVKVLENYYNETQESYNIIITPAFMGGKGATISGIDGKDNIYAFVSTTNMKDNIPYLDLNSLYYYVWHEFGHSYVNPLTEKHANRVNSTNKLFDPIKDEMSKQHYPNWSTCVNEHIIRAVQIRLLELNLGVQQSNALLNNEIRNRFIYIEPLIEKLKDFENRRDKNHLTFSEFYPELLNVLDSLQKVEYWKQVNPNNFVGPISSVFMVGGVWEKKLAIIYPTDDLDTEALKIVQNYVSLIFDRFFNPRGGILLADTTALKTDLSEYGILVYGTIESNLFLKRYASTFPFKIENQTIYADKEYTDKNVKFITCVPNPLNNKKGMAIYTALSNEAIQDINSVNHGQEDYILFLNRETVINRGFYKKEDKWKF